MAVLTKWVRANSSVNGNGNSYATAYNSLSWALYQIDGASDKGGTLYLVNDGTHQLDAAANRWMQINDLATDWDTDWGFRYVGSTSNGTLAMTEVQVANSNGTYKWIRAQGANTAYVKFEGLKFTEAASADANGNVHFDLAQVGSNAIQNDLMMFRYCSFQFGNTQAAAGLRKICDAAAYPGQIFLDHCYLRNVQNGIHDGGAAVPLHDGFSVKDCVIVTDKQSVSTTVAEATIEAGAGFVCQRNTVAMLITNTATEILSPPHLTRVNAAASNGTGTFQDNLYFVGTTGDGGSIITPPTVPVVAGYVNAHTFTFNTSNVDYNAFIITPACTGNEVGDFPYQFPYGTGGDLKTNDITVYDSTAADVFNDITSTFAWTVGSIEIELDYDLRPKLAALLTGGSGGGKIGALESGNQAPVAGNVTYTTVALNTLTVNATLGVLANSSDPDADTLSASVVTNVSNGTLTSFNTTTGSFVYTPDAGFAGAEQFTFKVSDGTTWSDTADADITVSNNTPTGANKAYETNEGVQLTVAAASGLLIGAADADGHTVSVTALGTPANGTLVGYSTTTGAFTYLPDGFFVGTDSFTFHITDTITNSVTYTASVVVSEVSAPGIENVIDTAPFFRPVLEVRTEMSFKNKKNRRSQHNLANYTKGYAWNESTHRVITLATNTTSQVTLGGIATAEYLIVESDYAINVSVNGTGTYWPVNGVVALALGSVTSVYIQNESTTQAVQVILAAAD